MPRSSKQGNDVAVQGTNDSSIVSKCSTVSQGYFSDDFLRLFVSKMSRRAPLINRGYYIRARAIEDVLKQFLSVNRGQKQIVSLGAGFDTAFFRLHARGLLANTRFWEVDFPDVVRRKATIIKRTAQLRQQLGEDIDDSPDYAEGVYLASQDYHLLGMDLTNLHGLQRSLQQSGINCRLPTLLLSECVLTYMEVCSSDALIQWAASSFPNAIFLTYEQIRPIDAFGLVMRRHFEKLNSPLKAIQTYHSTEAQKHRFLSLGWQETSAVDMITYYNTRLSVQERQRVELLEPFDEFEEWHLKCSHYAVVAGYNGTCSNMAEFLAGGHLPTTANSLLEHPSSVPTFPISDSQQRPLRRFGHASSLLSAATAVVVGGFGEAGGRHTRLGDVVVVDLNTGSWHTAPASQGTQELGPRMHHSLTAISGGNRWLLFGGRSSPTRPYNSTLILTFDTKQRAAAAPDSDDQMPTAAQLPDSTGVSPSTNNASALTINRDETPTKLTVQTCRQFDDPSSNTAKLRYSEENLFPRDITVCEIARYSYQCVDTPNSDGPSPRWRHSAIRAVVGGRECVVMYGGRGAEHTVYNDCWAFSVDKLVWEQLEIAGDQPPASHSHSACVWQGTRMVITGGLGVDIRRMTSVHVIDLESLRSQEMKLTPPLPPRYSHTAHVLSGRLLLVGGVNPLGGQGYTIAVIDLQALTWHLHSVPAHVVERPLMVHGHTSELLTDTSLAVLGGGGNCFSFGTHLNDSPIVVRVPL